MHANTAKSRIKNIVPVRGSTLTKEEADRYGSRMLEIAQEKGALTRHEILEDAISTDSPLHDAFEWDDEQAAHKYRLTQADYIATNIQVEFIMDDGSIELLPILPMIRVQVIEGEGDPWPEAPMIRGAKQARAALPQVMSDPKMREQWIRQLYRRLEAIRKDFEMVQDEEVIELFEALQRTLNKLLGALSK